MRAIRLALLAIFTLFINELNAQEYANAFNFIKPYNTLLEKYTDVKSVRGIQSQVVDYDAWRKDPLHTEAIALLENSAPEIDLKNQEDYLAFWINAYNLLTIDLIVKEKEKVSIKNLGGLAGSPWRAYH